MHRATAATKPLLLAAVVLLAAACASAGYRTATGHDVLPADPGVVVVPELVARPDTAAAHVVGAPRLATAEQAAAYVVGRYNSHDDAAIFAMSSKAGRQVVTYHRTFASRLRLDACVADVTRGVHECFMELDELPDASGVIVHRDGSAGRTMFLFRRLHSSAWQMIAAVDCAGTVH